MLSWAKLKGAFDINYQLLTSYKLTDIEMYSFFNATLNCQASVYTKLNDKEANISTPAGGLCII